MGRKQSFDKGGSKMEKGNLDRRSFLKGALAVGAVGAWLDFVSKFYQLK